MVSNFGLSFLIAIALINGINIVCNRVLNAKLGLHIGHLRSSLWNHIVGAVVLVPMVLLFSSWDKHLMNLDTPWYFYAGGLVGAIFVWMINWVVPKLGALKTMLILLTSQMLFGLIFDIVLGKITSVPMATLGIVIILTGSMLGRFAKS